MGLVPAAARVAFEDVEAFTGRPLAELAAEYWHRRAHDDRQAQERVAQAADEQAVLDYYRDTSQYLYELSYVEGSVKRQGWLRVLERLCRRYRIRRVLDVGGGIGSVSLYLYQRGMCCDHLDVPGSTYTYAGWRFARHGAQVGVCDATGVWPAGPYEAIIAWDVLEHLKTLDEKVTWLSQRLRPGGLLIHWSTFTAGECVHLAENHVYGDVRVFDALLQKRRLAFRGQLKPDHVSRALRGMGLKTATVGVTLKPRLKYGGCFLVHQRLDDGQALRLGTEVIHAAQ